MNTAQLEKRGRSGARRRRFLWATLLLLVVALLATLVWLAGRYEDSRLQQRLDREAAQATNELRIALNRNAQSLHALQYNNPSREVWQQQAAALMRERRELVRLEWRLDVQRTHGAVETPYRASVFELLQRGSSETNVRQTCELAGRISGPAYSKSYFAPQGDGLGVELMEMCLPLVSAGRLTGYLVATYALADMLVELVPQQLTRNQEISLTEGDGTRLAVRGVAQRSDRMLVAQQLLDLPGNTLVLRLDTWRGAPDLFPNVLTALVMVMSLALVSILVLLAKDMRRRLKAESDLADALAFRKAMEDSLVTGLRARDLNGRITYVNPAFCEMVGFSAQELLGQSVNAPYWPPEYADEYKKLQAGRLAGSMPPREGFESVYMHKDGTRFPVLIIEAPLINAQGTQTGWMSAFLDIREQKRVEELSRASQERLQATARLVMVGEMATLLSHELNQPLAAISSYAVGTLNLLQQERQPTDDIAPAMQRIAEQAERAGKVIKSVHDLVRRRQQAREAVEPQALLDAIMPLVQLQARKLGVSVKLEVAPDTPGVQCDRTMVEQVLLNLARNAMQAMDQPQFHERELALHVRRADGEAGRRVEFSVADAGPGIAPEIRDQLFTPFFTTKAEGMGLGLSLCRTVIEQHGGELRFAAREPRGTVFSFALAVA